METEFLCDRYSRESFLRKLGEKISITTKNIFCTNSIIHFHSFVNVISRFRSRQTLGNKPVAEGGKGSIKFFKNCNSAFPEGILMLTSNLLHLDILENTDESLLDFEKEKKP